MQTNIQKTYTITINELEYCHIKWSLVNEIERVKKLKNEIERVKKLKNEIERVKKLKNEIERVKKLNDENQFDQTIDELVNIKDMFIRYMDK